MKSIIFLVLCAITITSCTSVSNQTCFVCDSLEREHVSEFIKSSIKNANNMSDEEMEDVVRQLEFTAVRTNCHQKMLVLEFSDAGVNVISGLNENETYYRY